jgi:8-oxo-dGTP pyrophosphatase MutT (NUDIX family)
VSEDAKKLSVGVVVVRDTSTGIRFLLLRAFNHWDFPKGLTEAGEQPMQTALREVEEETTLRDLEFPWGEVFIETGPYSRGKIARYYVGRTRQEAIDLPVNPDLGRPEHSEYRWVSFGKAMALTSARVRPVVKWAIDVIQSAKGP